MSKKTLNVCLGIIFIGFFLSFGWWGFTLDDAEQQFRMDKATCLSATRAGRIVPEDVDAFCKEIEAEIQRRIGLNQEWRIQYLRDRAKEVE